MSNPAEPKATPPIAMRFINATNPPPDLVELKYRRDIKNSNFNHSSFHLQSFNPPDHRSLIPDHRSGLICGKNSTSRIDSWLVIIMAKRSIPIPRPAVGGIPYSMARRKSSSNCMASSSPLSRNFT